MSVVFLGSNVEFSNILSAAMQRLRVPDGGNSPGSVPPAPPANAAPAPAPPVSAPAAVSPHPVAGPASAEAPRSAFPTQRFPLHYGNNDNENINRQLRDLLQRHPDKMWPPRQYYKKNILIFVTHCRGIRNLD